MMFRAMVRDDARFYDPLGLVSEGHRGRLPGRRKCLPVRHAVHELPGARVRAGEAARLVAARRWLATLLLGRLPARVRPAARPGLAELDRTGSTSSSGRTWPRCASTPITPHRNVARQRAGRAVARGLSATTGSTLYAAVRYPGRVPHLVSDLAGGRLASPSSPEVKGAMQYRVASLALDPEAGTLFYTTDNLGYRNLMAYDLQDRASRRCCSRGSASATWRSTARTGRSGACARTTATSSSCASPTRTPNGRRCTSSRTARSPSTSTSRPTGRCCRPRMAGLDSSRAGAQVMQVRVMQHRRAARGRRDADAHARVRQLGAGGLRVLAGRHATCTAARTTPACRTSTATRSRPGRSRR